MMQIHIRDLEIELIDKLEACGEKSESEKPVKKKFSINIKSVLKNKESLGDSSSSSRSSGRSDTGSPKRSSSVISRSASANSENRNTVSTQPLLTGSTPELSATPRTLYPTTLQSSSDGNIHTNKKGNGSPRK